MSISRLSVKRPVSTMMVFTAVVILGLISWVRLPQELFPSISYPQITIVSSYQNAAPEEIENLVTKILEEAVGTVNKVKRIKSISKEGLSLVIIDFNWGTNMDFAALSVREKIDLIKEKLPRECEEPVVMKYNPFELPIMNLSVTAADIPSVELRKTTKKYIKEAIEKIDGVASAVISGGDMEEILVEIDQARLRASQISIVSIVENLKNANLNYPAGTIKENVYEYLIRTMGEFQTIEEIKETPMALELPEEEKKGRRGEEKEEEKRSRRLLYLKDIATVTERIKDITSVSRYNGKDSISLVIRKQSGVNTLKVAKKVRKEIKKLLKEKLPPGIDIKITYDQSIFITESISNLKNAAIQGGILAFFVLLFFLKDFLSSLTLTLSIPISLMATFCLMYFAKIDINMMSLGGLALGVGMFVDNSVVVIENIFRHRQMKKDLKNACGEGATEVLAPIIGSTLTTVAVFLPFAFVVGIAGQIFKQLSFTITFSLFISIFVAISLIPVIISLGKGKKISLTSSLSPQISQRFTRLLSSLLEIKGLIILIVTILFFISLWLLFQQERRFLPEVDQRQFIVKLELLPGKRLEVTDKMTKKIEKILLEQVPEIKDVTANIGSSEEKSKGQETSIKALGSHQAQILVNLKKLSARKNIKRSTKEIITFLKSEAEKDRELRSAQIEYIAQETSLGQALEETSPIVIEIRGPNLNKLTDISWKVKKGIDGIDGLYNIKTSLVAPTPETKIYVLKDRASLYGLSTRDIAITAQVALKGYVATQYKAREEGEDIDIRVRLRSQDRAKLENLRRILIRSPLENMVPLSEVTYFVKGSGPTEIQRINQQKTVLVTANILNRPLGKVMKEVSKIVEEVNKKLSASKDYTIEISGEQEKMKESFNSLAFALVLAIVLVYMIMASEFESLWQPFIIMFTVPLSLIGVAFTLILTKTPLSVVAYLGIIMLGGIVVNNGIVLIDFTNSLRKQGYSIKESAVKAAAVRLRPILMTSLTTILGMLPLSLGIGEGSELRAPMARTVIGGLISSTFLTLVIIPKIYIIIGEGIEKIKKSIFLLKGKVRKTIPSEKEIPQKQKPVIEEIPQPQEPLIKEKAPQKTLVDDKASLKRISAEITEFPPIEGKISDIPSQEKSGKEEKKEKEKEADLNSRQKELLEKLKVLKKISRVEYAKMFQVSIPTAARDLRDLTKNGLIIGKGPLGPGRWYELQD